MQNDDLTLASLVNHGSYAQRYTQVYWQRSWHRLDPDVDFDDDRDHPAASWRVRSRELDLLVRPRRAIAIM
ncbi:hypothetical protein [Nannocystis pusilla]|uniref:Uncharacterized protein n=1 Tax=Nannocystis pusilla TaxID=889268 RepID=A0ABS7TIK7_9BACT|nr:hypothetical protein [Nannocystis pusilla]MBZ5708040.1 hypothetical protein [Nannocystis pusilla]